MKEAVLPFDRFPEVDALLGPEMRSTGEVMGIAATFGLAFAKSQIAAGTALPEGGAVFFSLADRDKAGRRLAAARHSSPRLQHRGDRGHGGAPRAGRRAGRDGRGQARRAATGGGDAVDAVELHRERHGRSSSSTRPAVAGRGPTAPTSAVAALGAPRAVLTTASAARAAAAGIADWARSGSQREEPPGAPRRTPASR